MSDSQHYDGREDETLHTWTAVQIDHVKGFGHSVGKGFPGGNHRTHILQVTERRDTHQLLRKHSSKECVVRGRLQEKTFRNDVVVLVTDLLEQQQCVNVDKPIDLTDASRHRIRSHD